MTLLLMLRDLTLGLIGGPLPGLLGGLALAALLAGCGADGAPVPPSQAKPQTATSPSGTKVTISGEATVGVAARL